MSVKYEIGLPAQTKRPKKLYFLENIVILAFVVIVLAGIYWFVVKKASSAAVVKNNAVPHITEIKSTGKTTKIDEPTFSMELPGKWKETERNSDARYHSVKWTNLARGGIDRSMIVYVDIIPTDLATNFVLPISSVGSQLSTGVMSDNCVNFTPAAKNIKSSSVTGVSTVYQGVKFNCDGVHKLQQMVVASSPEGINTVTVTGPTAGTHKYFFVYNDNNYQPDYGIFTSILDSFRAK